MNNTINTIINGYTSGKVSVEETNKALANANAGFSFQPGKNALTADEIASTKVGKLPGDVTGYGLLSTGTGTMDKVHVVNGKVQGGAVNTVVNGKPNEYDLVYIGGQTWQVFGDQLGEIAPKDAPWWAPLHTFVCHVAWQDEVSQYIPEYEMVYNRPKYHGQEVVKGAIRYKYADNGTCKYQPKSMADYDKAHGRV